MLKMELYEEVITVASILIKFGFSEIVDNKEIFSTVLNDIGIKTTSGGKFTKEILQNFYSRMTLKERLHLIELFELRDF